MGVQSPPACLYVRLCLVPRLPGPAWAGKQGIAEKSTLIFHWQAWAAEALLVLGREGLRADTTWSGHACKSKSEAKLDLAPAHWRPS